MPTTPRLSRSWAAALTLVVLATGLAACVAEPDAGGATTAPATSGPSAGPSSTPTPTPTSAADTISLPTACDKIYSAGMLSMLDTQTPPLNDPGVTMLSTQNVDALEVLNSGAPTIRCSWGTPSESGMSTNVTIVDAAQSARVLAALQNSGFACAPGGGGTLCTFQQEQITQDDKLIKRGESHLVRGNGWIATSWLSVNPDGYTQDIAVTLWG
ncbi:hypothetical protein [Microbacterium sp. CJ88]|uniref:hypothetical protein n=1 Tax=Microbacterium sp. CJ88 TaxID=3445672 RepID=UPI003F658521